MRVTLKSLMRSWKNLENPRRRRNVRGGEPSWSWGGGVATLLISPLGRSRGRVSANCWKRFFPLVFRLILENRGVIIVLEPSVFRDLM